MAFHFELMNLIIFLSNILQKPVLLITVTVQLLIIDSYIFLKYIL